jgi:hypothetical protein
MAKEQTSFLGWLPAQKETGKIRKRPRIAMPKRKGPTSCRRL